LIANGLRRSTQIHGAFSELIGNSLNSRSSNAAFTSPAWPHVLCLCKLPFPWTIRYFLSVISVMVGVPKQRTCNKILSTKMVR
jgi:hypothetical protein